MRMLTKTLYHEIYFCEAVDEYIFGFNILVHYTMKIAYLVRLPPGVKDEGDISRNGAYMHAFDIRFYATFDV